MKLLLQKEFGSSDASISIFRKVSGIPANECSAQKAFGFSDAFFYIEIGVSDFPAGYCHPI